MGRPQKGTGTEPNVERRPTSKSLAPRVFARSQSPFADSLVRIPDAKVFPYGRLQREPSMSNPLRILFPFRVSATVAFTLMVVAWGCSRPAPSPPARDAAAGAQGEETDVATEPPAPAQAAQAVKESAAGPIRAAKETTFLLGPLTADGRVDYATAFNQRWSEGVTPENNFSVVLVRAFGPNRYPQESRDRYAALLGIEMPPPEGEYFVPLDAFVRQHHPQLSDDEVYAYSDRLAAARVRPWDEDEFPVLAAWLAANQKPLDQIVQGVGRPRCFSPLVGLRLSSQADTSVRTMTRDVARTLPARAMFKLKSASAEAGWPDLLACFRLAQHDIESSRLVNLLMGLAMRGLACDSARAFASYADLTADQQRAFQRDIAETEVPRLFGKQLEFERCVALEMVADMSRLGEDDAPNLELFRLPQLIDPQRPIDWNVALQEVNRDFDRLPAIVALSSVQDRDAALKRLATEIRNGFPGEPLSFDSLLDPERIVNVILSGETPQERGRRVATVTTDLYISTFDTVSWACGRSNDDMRLAQLSFALAGYRRDNGAFPGELAALVPQYMPSPGKSHLTDRAFHYRMAGTGFTISSFGPDHPWAALSSHRLVTAFDHRARAQADARLRQSGWEIQKFEAKSKDATPSDDDLLLVASLPEVEYLWIYDCSQLTDAALAHLKDMPKLRSVALWGATGITVQGFAHVARVSLLKHLSLSDCAVTGDGLRHLSQLKQLVSLQLRYTRFEDGDLVHLSSLPALASLDLTQTEVTDAGLEHILRLKKLTDLDLAKTNVSDAGLAKIAQMQGLTSLDLSGTNVSEGALVQLASLKLLESLDVTDLSISAAGLERIEQALPNCLIEH